MPRHKIKLFEGVKYLLADGIEITFTAKSKFRGSKWVGIVSKTIPNGEPIGSYHISVDDDTESYFAPDARFAPVKLLNNDFDIYLLED